MPIGDSGGGKALVSEFPIRSRRLKLEDCDTVPPAEEV
jgi:hypothetical protein